MEGRKESETEGAEAGTARWAEESGGGRCVNWQRTDRWKERGGVRAGSVKESIMGCRLMAMVVL